MISATSKRSTPFRGLAVALVVADNTPYEIRTHATAVKRQCLNHLTNGACSGVSYLSQIPLFQTFVACYY